MEEGRSLRAKGVPGNMDYRNDEGVGRQGATKPALASGLGRRVLAVIGFAAAHFALMFLVFLAGFGEVMKAWDSPDPPGLSAQLNRVFLEVLGFPGIAILNSNRLWTSPFAGWIYCGNSVLWGIAIVCVYHAYRGSTVRYRARVKGL